MGVEMQVAGAVLGLIASQKQAKIHEMQAQAYKEQADLAELQADQQEQKRNEMLRRQLASLGTSMSAQGVALGTSASVGTLRDDEIQMARKDIANIKLMGMGQRRKYEIGAAGQQAAGGVTRLGGMAGFAKSVYTINNPGSSTG